jgi:hypothetical protein
MKFEVGQYYRHANGRAIAVVGEVETWKWSTMLVIEETDPTGHSISVVEKSQAEDTKDRWVQIGVEEWKNAFGIVEA